MRDGAEPGGPSRWLSPERVFVVLALVFGAAFAALSPPNDPPDEVRHMARAWLISEGRLGVARGESGRDVAVPSQLVEIHRPHGTRPRDHRSARWLEARGEPIDLGRRTLVPYTPPYSPLPFLHQAAALGVGRGLGASPPTLFYLGRAANLLVFVTLGWLAIRLCPLRRWPLAMLLLLPMSVYQAGAMSTDPATLALSALWFAGVLRVAVSESRTPIGPREIGGLAAIALALGMAKPGYWTLGALALVIPTARYRNVRWRVAALVVWALALLAPPALWLASQQIAAPVGPEGRIDPMAQLAGMLTDPMGFVGVVARTVWIQGIPLVAGFTGVLGQLDIPLPLALYALVPIWIVWTVLSGPPDPDVLGPPQRWGLVALFAASALGILALAYVSWNPVGSPVVLSIQGRYFAPLAPLLLLAIPSGRVGRGRPSPLGLAIVPTAVLTVAVVAVARHYYGGS